MARSVPFRKTNSPDMVISRLQDAIGDSLAPLTSNPILDGTLIEGLVVTAIPLDTHILHGLGRPARGYLIVSSTQYVRARVSSTKNPIPERELLLNFDADSVVSLWVF